MTTEQKARQICAALIAKKVLHKDEVKELFRDESLRIQVENTLKTVGLELSTHIYTEHVAVKVGKEMETTVFDDGHGGWLKSNVGLSRGGLALLVILWAKLILPKRQMQIDRMTPDDLNQLSLLKERKSIPHKELVKLEEKTILADFGDKLGGKTKFRTYLAELSRHGFIYKRDEIITEGPMLDTIIDDSILASRIIDGCLAEIIGVETNKDIPAEDREKNVSV